jgi:hypothetical protein
LNLENDKYKQYTILNNNDWAETLISTVFDKDVSVVGVLDVGGGIYTDSGYIKSLGMEKTAYVYAECEDCKSVAIAANTAKNGGLYDVTNQKWMFYSNSSGTIMSNASDRRVKNDHGIISRHDSLAILRTPIHEFSYIADELGTLQYGIMAQDLRDTLVNKGIGYRSMLQIQVKNSDEITQDLLRDESEVEYGIDYSKIVPVLMDGWQYHDDKIRDLTDQLKQALERIETQEQAIRELSIV